MTTCVQPGCGGVIQDGYCDTCGLAASAPSGPSAPSRSRGRGSSRSARGRLGGAEDSGLAQHYDRARDLLWTAPCDLAAAEAAVAAYQQAVLGVQP